MRKKFIKWLIAKFPKREVTPELRKRIKAEFPGYHLQKNGSGRRKSVQKPAREFYEKEAEERREKGDERNKV